MNAVPFDTLKLAKKLEASGMTGATAAGAAEALAEAMSSAEWATKADINDLRTELKGDINDLRTELKADISGLRTELKADISGLRTELKGGLDVLRREIEISQRDVVIKLGRMLVVMSGLLIAAIRYLPPHP